MSRTSWLRFCQKLGGNALATGAVVLLFLTLQALAISPQLHEALHPDSHQPDHQCAIKLLTEGQLEFEPDSASVLPPRQDFLALYLPEEVLRPVPPFQLPPGRGPPVFLP